MINVKVKNTNVKIKIEGMGDDLIAEMLIVLKVFNERLREGDVETAKALQKTLIECQTTIFGYEQTAEVYKEMHEQDE